ncbi:RICIN domain-containing protein [Actinosynnema sp. CS-041913]|uniref:RICIN domain-containing protein n=1 Tax=Actinosynnema sp. CS-041913 TaxID=3239917 RepID=UPI003D91D8C1
MARTVRRLGAALITTALVLGSGVTGQATPDMASLLVVRHSGQCLTVGPDLLPRPSILQQPCEEDSPSQQWDLDHLGSGRHHIVSALSGQCLEVDHSGLGDLLTLWTCNGSGHQQWDRIGAFDSMFRNADSGKCVTVDEASHVVGTPVVQSSCAYGSHQRWTVR